jgi:hypothetical protein
MDDEADQLVQTVGRDPYGALGLDDPEVAFAGVRALRQLAEFCERYQVSRLREAGQLGRDRRMGRRQCSGTTQEAC